MSIEFLWDFSALERLQQALEEFPELFSAEMLLAVGETVDIWFEDLTEYPPSPTYPIQWASKRQKDAFFASNGFGFGVPHERTGRLPDSWQEEVTAPSSDVIQGKVFTVESWARWIQDENFQSPIHSDRWLTTQQELANTHQIAQEKILEGADHALKQLAAKIQG